MKIYCKNKEKEYALKTIAKEGIELQTPNT
jgi:hypothetical protein